MQRIVHRDGLALARCGQNLGRGWQRGQEYEDLFMNGSRTIAAPHRLHGLFSWPYALSDRSKYPDCPLTLT
jgi:hypothetical protein